MPDDFSSVLLDSLAPDDLLAEKFLTAVKQSDYETVYAIMLEKPMVLLEVDSKM